MTRHAFLFVLAIFLLGALPAYAASSYFQVAGEDVNQAVGSALVKRGAAEKIKATIISANPTLYESNAPLSVAIQALTFDKNAYKWQANMHVMERGKTVAVMPIQGKYEPLVSVPVLTRQVSRDDVITAADLSWMDYSLRHLRKDAIREEADIIGKSPKRAISEGRPVRLSEINLPILVKKGAQVSVTYSSAFMNIQTVGEALEDGSKGNLVRIKNTDTKRAFTARVTGESTVEANMQHTMTN